MKFAPAMPDMTEEMKVAQDHVTHLGNAIKCSIRTITADEHISAQIDILTQKEKQWEQRLQDFRPVDIIAGAKQARMAYEQSEAEHGKATRDFTFMRIKIASMQLCFSPLEAKIVKFEVDKKEYEKKFRFAIDRIRADERVQVVGARHEEEDESDEPDRHSYDHTLRRIKAYTGWQVHITTHGIPNENFTNLELAQVTNDYGNFCAQANETVEPVTPYIFVVVALANVMAQLDQRTVVSPGHNKQPRCKSESRKSPSPPSRWQRDRQRSPKASLAKSHRSHSSPPSQKGQVVPPVLPEMVTLQEPSSSKDGMDAPMRTLRSMQVAPATAHTGFQVEVLTQHTISPMNSTPGSP